MYGTTLYFYGNLELIWEFNCNLIAGQIGYFSRLFLLWTIISYAYLRICESNKISRSEIAGLMTIFIDNFDGVCQIAALKIHQIKIYK